MTAAQYAHRHPLSAAFRAQIDALACIARHGYAPAWFCTPDEWQQLERRGLVQQDGNRYTLPSTAHQPAKAA